ncbi:MAG: dienelactone hydrolase family protein [Planctomycetales bacterium]
MPDGREFPVSLGIKFLVLWGLTGGLFPRFGAADPRQDQLEREFQQIQRSQIETYLDRELQKSYGQRHAEWKRDFASIPAYLKSIEPWRKRFVEYLGGMPYQGARLDPREDLIWEKESHRAYRVRFRAFEDVEVYGILLTPRKFEGKRPALICVHGMLGTPELVCGIVDKTDYHRRFGLQAVERGYVVFAPLNINTAFRREWLDRKGIMLGQRLQGLEQYKYLRMVDYLASRSDVTAERIGIYGISWGGRTAMYAAAIDQRWRRA